MSERNEIHELALKFIESEEMREYWGHTLLSENTRFERLIFDPVRDCRAFITGSRSSVDDKLAALRKLYPDKETLNLIRAAETALTETNNTNGDVFLTTLHLPYDTGDMETWEERKPFLSFESVISYVQRETASQCKLFEESLEQCMERIWYEVEKFIRDGNGELLHKITWTLNAKGEILFFELADDFQKSSEDDDWEAWSAWEGSGHWVYPPVPFDFGDVITIDMRPFYESFHGVVVRIGNNCGIYTTACIYCDAHGYLDCNMLKHDMGKVLTKVSPLYRAEKFMGELPENERALKIISEAIKKIPSAKMNSGGNDIWRRHELADQFYDFLSHSYYKKQNGSLGCSWDEFRERFKI